MKEANKSIKCEEKPKAVQMMFDLGGFNNAFAEEIANDFEMDELLSVMQKL